MSEQRFIEIETRLAHQEQTLIELNAVITKQQEIIMKLERVTVSMAGRLSDLQAGLPELNPEAERPPHY